MISIRIFYGWWIVGACLIAALVGNALGLFGSGVYLHALVQMKGWPTGLVSGAVTLFYVTSALLLIPVGSAIHRFGPRPVIALGGALMAGGVTEIGRVSSLWQVYAAFLAVGGGWACLSTTAVATTLAPWFEKHQGRAVPLPRSGPAWAECSALPLCYLGLDALDWRQQRQ
jgi:hypothetical protein